MYIHSQSNQLIYRMTQAAREFIRDNARRCLLFTTGKSKVVPSLLNFRITSIHGSKGEQVPLSLDEIGDCDNMFTIPYGVTMEDAANVITGLVEDSH